MPDVSIVGSGPNGMAAAVVMARAGLSVELHEKESTLGGGARTKELTLPGFRHDVGSAVHPMSFASEFFQKFGLADRVDFHVPDISYVHPLARGEAAVAYRDLARTCAGLGRDGASWRSLIGPIVDGIQAVSEITNDQLLRIPSDFMVAARFGARALEQGTPLWNLRFRDDKAPAMLTGVMAHAIGRLPSLAPAGVGLVLAAHAHARGWPVPRAGSQAIIDAMEQDFVAHGGRVFTSSHIEDSRAIRSSAVRLFDVSARSLARIAGHELPARYRRALQRFRYGDAIAKVDFALSGPVPWINPEARRTPTLHVGGLRSELANSERVVAVGGYPSNPYVLVSQPTVVDPTRAPAGKHVLWTYTHVPAGSPVDPTETITLAIERYAPGFRDTIEASASMTALDLEAYDGNFVGGDISAGALVPSQLIARPVISRSPWRTPVPGMYLGSSSTPPATGVHGMCGFHAARTALRDVFGLGEPHLGATD